ncbi:DNA (cytosine-5-)-methyltransferase [uncultured Sunxiuqinia sp.]|uniref:DNA (cytosine-5-)-methyltransferase n=1 Tax=uncultured Sunxiuqinia sp. TaxID=1573825 RepID=UPI002AA7D0D1|nr:DNA (cytosine-5-)-methyltransferase [uncultured Sunxiuqinia sp.]
MIKYSTIRKKLELEKKKELDDSLAGFTHFLHSPQSYSKGDYYKPFESQLNGSSSKILKEPEQQLSLIWDIPFPPPKEPKFTFIDLFAGIGGIRMAYQNEGGKCVFSSEYNKFAKVTYEANFGEVPFGDITKIDEKFIPEHDVLLAGFPCQPFSIAGVSKKNSLGRNHGFLDETQGTLFFDIARILQEKKPKAFMLENVKNLISHDKGNTFNVIKRTLEQLNYSIHYRVLDGKHFVPQHRERIIIVGFLKDIFRGEENFSFPQMPDPTATVREILDGDIDPKYTLSDKLWNYLKGYAAKHKAQGNGFGYGMANLDGISRTMSARYYKDGAEILIPQNGSNPRRLTPRECARLQGFSDKFVIPVSDNQAYRQFGNSVVTTMIQAVAKQIVKILEYE